MHTWSDQPKDTFQARHERMRGDVRLLHPNVGPLVNYGGNVSEKRNGGRSGAFAKYLSPVVCGLGIGALIGASYWVGFVNGMQSVGP